MSLSTGQIVIITASLAAVGAVTVYFIAKKDEPPPFGPKPPGKKIAHARAAARRPGHAPPRFQQPHYDAQHYTPPPQAFHEHPYHYTAPPAAPPYHAPPPPEHVEYHPAPMPPLQPTATHEWPRTMPSQAAPVEHATQETTPTYWRDLARQLQLLNGPLLTVLDAQKNLNRLGVVPHGEHLKEDNILGERTTNALSDFQEHHHIPMTGNLDPETAAAILYDMYMMYRAQAGGAA